MIRCCLIAFIIVIVSISCQSQNNNERTVVAVASPTTALERQPELEIATPTQNISNDTRSSEPFESDMVIPDELTICTQEEPASLFLLATKSRINSLEKLVLDLLYDGDIYNIHDSIPSPILPTEALEVTVDEVLVQSGDFVYGELFEPYTGEPVNMPQVTIIFKIKPDLRWSDGVQVTAHDSVNTYQILHSADLPSFSESYPTISSYIALDEFTIQWIGLPGYLPSDYEAEFFLPVPQHVFSETMLLEWWDEAMLGNILPLGFGPYQIVQWEKQSNLVLETNNYYEGNSGNLSVVSKLSFVFVMDEVEGEALLDNGQCDLLVTEPINLDWLNDKIESTYFAEPY